MQAILVVMRKLLWMIGLSIALLVNGGLLVACCVAVVRLGHLNSRVLLMLLGIGWITWIVARQMFLGARELTGELPIEGGASAKSQIKFSDHSMMTMVAEISDQQGDGVDRE
jgi:hypothetical protein